MNEQQHILEAHGAEAPNFPMQLRIIKAVSCLAPVGSESAVCAAPAAVIGEVERDIERDGFAEMMLRQFFGTSRHRFQAYGRCRRQERGEFA